MIQKFKAAYRASTPLIGIRTPDPFATEAAVKAAVQNGQQIPVCAWDIIRGLRGLNETGQEFVAKTGMDPMQSANFPDCFGTIQALNERPVGLVFLIHNAHRILGEPAVSQAVLNCRDSFKAVRNSLVLLGPDFTLPAELQNDVLVFDEPLPSNDDLEKIVGDVYGSAELPAPPPDTMRRCVEALSGLAAFPAEQAAAMNLRKSGINTEDLWDTKRSIIRSTPGLGITKGGMTFDGLGGNDNIKEFLRGILNGNDRPSVIVFQDEIEKAFAGVGTDTSGVATEMTGTILSEMEDQGYIGAIFLGHPGAGKTAIAQAAGAEVGIPTITFDLSAMKGSLVGQSGANLRSALKVVRAVSQGKCLFLATCNSLSSLPPELKRRYKLGTFFFDLPTEEEREIIWRLYCKRYNVGGETPDDAGWTGAEIRNCAELAWRLNTSLRKAAEYITPIIRTSPDKVEGLRQQAAGRYLSSSYSGLYRLPSNNQQPNSNRRMLAVEE